MNSATVAVLFGLGGAIGWGVSNFFASQSSRKSSPLKTVFVSQAILFLIMAVLAVIFRPAVDISLNILMIIVISYLIFTVGLVVSYKAYEIGPISLTSPIVGAFSIIVVASSVLFLDASLQAIQWIGLLLLFTGLFMALMQKNKSQSWRSSGIALAFIALIFMGVGLSGYVYAIGKIGWFYTVLLGYFFTAFWSAMLLIYKKEFKTFKLPKSTIGLIIFQIIGTLSVSIGVERSLSVIIVPVSSLSPLATSLLGILIYKEAVTRQRLYAVLIIIISLVLVSFN